MKQIAVREAEKASATMREADTAEAEKKALLEKFSKRSGVSDQDRLARAAKIIRSAADNGLTEVQVGRFLTPSAPIAVALSISASLVGKRPLRMSRRNFMNSGKSKCFSNCRGRRNYFERPLRR